MYVNCAHGKGIKFIREELKFFAKTHIISNGGDIFKSVILLNADKLTMDAQSALRRCIELFSHSTRFFIIIEDKYKLLKPILSRFCEIYIPELIINNSIVNLHNYNLTFNKINVDVSEHLLSLQKEITNYMECLKKQDTDKNNTKKNVEFALKLYEKGYSGLDIIELVERNIIKTKNIERLDKKYEFLVTFNKIRKEFRNEKLLILFILHFMFLSSDYTLENISFM